MVTFKWRRKQRDANIFSFFFAASNRKKLAQTDSRLVQYLIALMDTKSLKVQCQAALALRNLASDGSN